MDLEFKVQDFLGACEKKFTRALIFPIRASKKSTIRTAERPDVEKNLRDRDVISQRGSHCRDGLHRIILIIQYERRLPIGLTTSLPVQNATEKNTALSPSRATRFEGRLRAMARNRCRDIRGGRAVPSEAALKKAG